MLVKAINRSAVLAWSPKFDNNLIVACGSKIDSSSKLELFDLSSTEPVELVSIEIPSRFNRLLWTSVEANSKELIIAALENGNIEIFNSQMLLSADSEAMIKSPSLHLGPVNGLCLSKFQPNLIASGSNNGEIALWDMNNLEKAALLNIKKTSKFTNVSDLSWNPKVPHIISAASDSGLVSIIDLRAKKEVTVLSLNANGSCAASSLAWHPEISTNIMVSSDSKSHPFAYLFDLRNSGSAKSIFKGHSDGIISLSWCAKDPEMILSSGLDHKTLCWNPQTNEIIKEYSHKDTFGVQWCPKDPNIFCASTLQDGIVFHSINDSQGEDIVSGGNKISPQWLNCPIGASFGANNTLVIFRPDCKNISLVKPKVEMVSSIYDDLLKFEADIAQNNIKNIFENIINIEADTTKKALFKVMTLLLSENIKFDLLELVGDSFIDEENCSHESIDPQYSSLSLNKIDFTNFGPNIVDKIIKNDFEGAVLTCIENRLFTDALFISNYGSKELREKTEIFILKTNNHFYLNLAKCISTKEFDEFVYKSPISQWGNILKAICLHSSPKALPVLSNILFSRLISENLEYPALFVMVLTRDPEKIVERCLKVMSSFSQNSDFDSSMDCLIKTYKLLRTLECCFPNYVASITDIELVTTIFEIITKIKMILLSFGLNEKIVIDLVDKKFFDDHMKNKNSEIDLYMENRFGALFIQDSFNESLLEVSTSVKCSHSVGPKILSNSSPPSALSTVYQSTPLLQPSTAMYNDAPIIISNFSKLSPQIGHQEINIDIVRRALNILSESVNSKTLNETTYRIISDCFKKLCPDLICSKDYSNLSKTSIITLFKELAAGNFETASPIASNILTSFFTETKDWILSLKRLIDIAKI